MTRPLLAVAILLASLATPAVTAAPYTPSRDDEILETLPVSLNPATRELQNRHQQLVHEPENMNLAVDLARRYIALGQAESDPRYFGYAEGVLQPWWQGAKPPGEVLLLRATIRQNRHEFDLALKDLSELLAMDPRNPQAWLTQATIRQVRGEYEKAEWSCRPLILAADAILSMTCLTQVRSLSGQGQQSYTALSSFLETDKHSPAKLRSWSLVALAEMAVRLGKNPEAETWFKTALAGGQRDVYLLMAYTDFLLDQRRDKEVIALLQNEKRIDGLYLRLALAEQRLDVAQYADDKDNLSARFAASRQRGDSLHQGDEARFTLHLLKQAQTALELAERNWRLQREPRDARIFLESAIAADKPETAQPVLEMLRKTRLEDVRLASLVAQLEAKS